MSSAELGLRLHTQQQQAFYSTLHPYFQAVAGSSDAAMDEPLPLNSFPSSRSFCRKLEVFSFQRKMIVLVANLLAIGLVCHYTWASLSPAHPPGGVAAPVPPQAMTAVWLPDEATLAAPSRTIRPPKSSPAGIIAAPKATPPVVDLGWGDAQDSEPQDAVEFDPADTETLALAVGATAKTTQAVKNAPQSLGAGLQALQHHAQDTLRQVDGSIQRPSLATEDEAEQAAWDAALRVGRPGHRRDNQMTASLWGAPLLPNGAAANPTVTVQRLNHQIAEWARVNALPRGIRCLHTPVRTASVSSRFGMRRGRFHSGTDYAAKHGSEIVASADGVVQFAGWRGGYGNLVVVLHANGLVTRYAHCSHVMVQKGQPVAMGQIIARVGSTGHSTGPHLHYEVLAEGVPQNPEHFLIR
jgi:murein DD-endopeptidase MepM/ murein hydrolase activator NlpD